MTLTLVRLRDLRLAYQPYARVTRGPWVLPASGGRTYHHRYEFGESGGVFGGRGFYSPRRLGHSGGRRGPRYTFL